MIKKIDMRGPLIETITKSLKDKPEDWYLSDSYLTHKSGVRIGWAKSRSEPAPPKGSLWLEYNYKQGESSLLSSHRSIHRWLDLEEYTAIWGAVVESKAAQDLKDQIMIDKLTE